MIEEQTLKNIAPFIKDLQKMTQAIYLLYIFQLIIRVFGCSEAENIVLQLACDAFYMI